MTDEERRWPDASAEDQAPWLAASTLVELGELTAQWLEGSRSYCPFDAAPGPADETRDLIPVLARVNRAGFWTDQSQPGVPLVDGYGQRAAVDGFCSADVADRIRSRLLGSDLIVLALGPGEHGVQIVATIDGGQECTWWGGGWPTEIIPENFLPHVSVSMVRQLIESWQVHVIDPVWGRNDLLWPLLLDALV